SFWRGISPAPTHINLADSSTLARVSADVNGDGLDDLVLLVADGPTLQHIAVLLATGTGYAAPSTWWDAKVAGTTFASWPGGLPGLQMLAGDFDADGVTDLALVVPRADPGTATVYRLRSTKTGLEALATIYTGTLDPATSRTYAGDVTGDGRADVVIETDLGASGLSYSVLASGPSGTLSAPVQWYVGADLLRATTLTTVTDFDRDGRDDIVLAVKTDIGFALVGMRATGSAFARTTLATSTLAFGQVKLGAGDFNGDGRGDVLVYAALSGGATGSRLTTYLSNGTLLTAANWLDDAKLTWTTIEPY
ncbi:MAG: FG-GAP repeat domain-containing protein, partial [Candidatus Limnocylindrales bacterium]